MNKNDIVDIIFQTHTAGKERTIIYKNTVLKLENEDISDTIKEIVTFFSSQIPVHFKSEEIIIDILKTMVLSANNLNAINEILTEHKDMIEKLEELKNQTKKNSKALKEDSIEKMNNLIEQLFDHAKKEDQILFPLARERINEKQKEELRIKIENLHKKEKRDGSVFD